MTLLAIIENLPALMVQLVPMLLLAAVALLIVVVACWVLIVGRPR